MISNTSNSYDDIMANKTATVLARVDPKLKEDAEYILDRLGIPVSLLINMLYKQIVLTKSIPFALTLPVESGEMNLDHQR